MLEEKKQWEYDPPRIIQDKLWNLFWHQMNNNFSEKLVIKLDNSYPQFSGQRSCSLVDVQHLFLFIKEPYWSYMRQFFDSV